MQPELISKKLLRCVITSVFLMFPLSAICKSNDNSVYWLTEWDEGCYQNNKNVCREAWYTTPQGSHMMLYEVFRALEVPESKKLFASKDNLSQYGFLYPGGKAKNGAEESVEPSLPVDGLPLGLVKDQSLLDNLNYLGFTCAACHTGEVAYGGKRYYIEAGQAKLDLFAFNRALVEAVQANRSGKKLKRFNKRFKALVQSNYPRKTVDPKAGEEYLAQALESFGGFMGRNVDEVEFGPGRLDAIGVILNEVIVHQAGLDANGESQPKPLTAPVNYPYIWDAPDLSCIQTNCVSADPLTRNAAQVLGVWGGINLDDDEAIPDITELVLNKLGMNNLFETTVKVDGLFSLETNLGKINAPQWPASFPALDETLLNEGKTLYTEHCAGCHVDVSDGVDESELSEPNGFGFRFTKVLRVPFTEVGTDPVFIQDHAFRSEPTGILGTVLALNAPDSVDPVTGIPFGLLPPQELNALTLLGVTSAIIEKNFFESEAFKAEAEAAFPDLTPVDALKALALKYTNGQIQPRNVNLFVYRAKPLNGIAFTGPYLHNGSVRTLADLLKQPDQRPASFNVGSTEFDPENVGYVDAGDFVLDTSLRGNSNLGHDYGTDLSDSEKRALLEYLKSI